MSVYDIFHEYGFRFSVPVCDERHGSEENTNGGNYVLRVQFWSPAVGTYLVREDWSYQGDLVSKNEWEQVSFPVWVREIRRALEDNTELPYDLRMN